MKAVYPGSFDPLTYGHLDVIRRAARLCDTLVVAVLINIEKKALFSTSERVDILKHELRDIPNVIVREFQGMTVDLCREEQAEAIIRGVRNDQDFAYENQLCQINRSQAPEVETLLICTDVRYSFVSSSGAKEIAAFGGDLSGFLPPYVEKKVIEKYREKKQ